MYPVSTKTKLEFGVSQVPSPQHSRASKDVMPQAKFVPTLKISYSVLVSGILSLMSVSSLPQHVVRGLLEPVKTAQTLFCPTATAIHPGSPESLGILEIRE